MFPRRRNRYYCDRMGNCVSRFRAHFRPGDDQPEPRSDHNRNFLLAESQSLIVRDLDFMISHNSWINNTHKFWLSKNNQRLVVRRGNLFKLKIKFNRKINKADDIINVIFTVKDAPNPIYSQNTAITIPVVLQEKIADPFDAFPKTWHAKAKDIDDNILILEITPGLDAIIGEWRFSFDTKSKSLGNSSLYNSPIKESIFVLFNPWHKKDLVYLKDKESRIEYVLNDSGIIWRGTHDRLKPTPWNFSQHEENILECCLYALSHIGKLNVEDRGDPIKVARHISSIVNSVDDNGIVVGHWKEDFSGGTKPTDWLGSFAILNKFYKTKRPVKYGQCWVFSGVTTTVCRCLGIPSRVITNYQSAHDTHASLTVDRFFNEDGDPIKEMNTDSIWNFHTWNEVWMRRPDLSLSGAYDGWQVIDSTPQEPSDGLYRCGPTSVEAIKQGDIHKQYDGKFVFAEVNADEVFWLHQGEKQPIKLISEETAAVGLKISTKSATSNSRVDLTESYKHEESSPEEREIFLKALRKSRHQFSRYYLNEKFEDIKFDFSLLDDILIGKTFNVRLRITNKSDRVYTIRSVIGIRTSLYNGVTKYVVKKDKQEFRVGPKEIEEIKVPVTYEEYEHHLADQSIFNITVMALVEETQFQYYAMDDFRLRMPDIIIQTEGDLIQGRPFICHVSFTNPLPKPLTKGMFLIEGPEYSQTSKIELRRPVMAAEEARASLELVPRTVGKKTIAAKFTSRELSDVDGYKNIRVSPGIPTDSNVINNSFN